MRYMWEESDIYSRYIIENSCKDISDNLSFACSVSFQICWITGKDDNQWGYVNNFTDGWVFIEGSKTQLMKKLNNNKWGYRPANDYEVKTMIDYQLNSLNNVKYKETAK